MFTGFGLNQGCCKQIKLAKDGGGREDKFQYFKVASGLICEFKGGVFLIDVLNILSVFELVVGEPALNIAKPQNLFNLFEASRFGPLKISADCFVVHLDPIHEDKKPMVFEQSMVAQALQSLCKQVGIA